jgi:hypothetical protein
MKNLMNVLTLKYKYIKWKSVTGSMYANVGEDK